MKNIYKNSCVPISNIWPLEANNDNLPCDTNLGADVSSIKFKVQIIIIHQHEKGLECRDWSHEDWSHEGCESVSVVAD